MNIFRILSSSDGSINEPNVSSFLAYLLDPTEDHGLSCFFLKEFLSKPVLENKEFFKKIINNDELVDLSKYSKYTVEIHQELSVFIDDLNTRGNNKRRDIDIVIEIKDQDNIIYSIAIENKITDSSIVRSDTQLQDEYNGLQNYYEGSETEIFLIYLTPRTSNCSTDSFNKLMCKDEVSSIGKFHMYWDDDNEANDSIFNQLNRVFQLERTGYIDSINNQSMYLIKSFMSFIKTNFKSYLEEKEEKSQKQSYGKPVIDLLKDYCSENLKEDQEYNIDDIKNKFTSYVKEKSGKTLLNSTRNVYFYKAVVNEQNRIHYNVKDPNDARMNLLYYVDPKLESELESKRKPKLVKIFHPHVDGKIQIYFKEGKNMKCVLVKDVIYKSK